MTVEVLLFNAMLIVFAVEFAMFVVVRRRI